MSTLMRFERGVESYQFEDGGSYPATRTVELLQVRDRTAAGTLETEDLGIALRRRTIVFELMSENDYNGLLDWFLNIVNGGQFSFTFVDEYGVSGEVKFVDTTLDFPETSYKRYSGSVTLEYV